MGQGLRAGQNDRGVHRGTGPRAGHAAGALRRRRVAGAYRHAREDRPADPRGAGDADRGTAGDRRRNRSRTLRDRTRHGGRALRGGADAHAEARRRRQEDPLGTLAQRSGAGGPQTVPARRTAADRRCGAHALRPAAGAERTPQGGADAGLHPPPDRHALVVRALVRGLRRNARGRHAAARRGVAHSQPESAGIGRRLRLVVPARPHDDHAPHGFRGAALQRRGGPDEPRQERTGGGGGHRGRRGDGRPHGDGPLSS